MQITGRALQILVVDRHILFRQGLVSLLNSYPSMEVAGEAAGAGEMLEKALTLGPDIVLVSIDDPYSDVLSSIRELLVQLPDVKVVVLYTQLNEELLFASLLAGVKGFIPKDIDHKKLILSLDALRRGELAISRSLIRKVIEEYIRLGKTQRTEPEHELSYGLEKLTPREVEVLVELGKRVKNQAIAESLSISENTVRVHVHNILDKLRLQNRTEAGKFASRVGLCNFPEIWD